MKILSITQARRRVGRGAVVDKPFREQKYLSAKEVAGILGVHERTIRNLATLWKDTGGHEGIPGILVGKVWRFEESAVTKWLERQQHPSAVQEKKKSQFG
jgi:hypothetical protein